MNVARLPGRLATTLRTAATLTRAGVVRPHRPDRVLRTGLTLLRWGATPAAGYAVAAARYPDAVAVIDARAR